jgi:hypothetical protein
MYVGLGLQGQKRWENEFFEGHVKGVNQAVQSTYPRTLEARMWQRLFIFCSYLPSSISIYQWGQNVIWK